MSAAHSPRATSPLSRFNTRFATPVSIENLGSLGVCAREERTCGLGAPGSSHAHCLKNHTSRSTLLVGD